MLCRTFNGQCNREWWRKEDNYELVLSLVYRVACLKKQKQKKHICFQPREQNRETISKQLRFILSKERQEQGRK